MLPSSGESDIKLGGPDGSRPNAEFLALFGEAYAKLRALAISLVGNAADADDVMQEASLILWEKFSQFEPGTSFRRWASAVVLNVARRHRHTRFRRHAVTISEEAMAAVARARSGHDELFELRREYLEDCLAKVSEDERRLLLECTASDVSVVQWARERGVSHNTLYGRLRRLRRRLYDCVSRKLGSS